MGQGQLTFFGGVDAGGGVQLMYGKHNDSLLFDFGAAHRGLLDPGQVNSHHPVKATAGREIRQYVLSRIAPPLLNLYDSRQLEGLDPADVRRLWHDREFPHYKQQSLFIGHIHQDHMSLLPYARPGLKVYMHKDAHALYRGLVRGGHYPDTAAELIPCDDLSVVDFGSFTMQIVEMDHNIIGAAGLIIDSGEHKIAYTGDWRRHGRHPERIDRFIDLCRERGIDILITEGTRVPASADKKHPLPVTDQQIDRQFTDIAASTAGLLYVMMVPRDIERFAEWIAIAAQHGRSIALDASFAAIWQTVLEANLRLLDGHPARQANIFVVDETADGMPELPYPRLSLEQLAKRRTEFIYFIRYPHLAHMIELETIGSSPGCSQLVHSDLSVKLDDQVVQRYIDAYGIIGHSLGNGGHAHADVVSELIERIAPKAVIPVHTWHRSNLDTRGVGAYYPERGETAAIDAIVAAASAAAAKPGAVNK